MNKHLFIGILIGVLSLCSGCIVRSIHPFSTSNRFLRPELNGTWERIDVNTRDEEPKEIWIFTDEEVLISDDTEFPGKLSVSYFQMNETVFMETTVLLDEQRTGYAWGHLLPVHLLFKLVYDEKTVTLYALKEEALLNLMTERHLSLPYLRLKNDEIIFTASSEEWETFLRAYGDHAELYENEYVLQFVRHPDEKK